MRELPLLLFWLLPLAASGLSLLPQANLDVAGQMVLPTVQVKITDAPFQVSNAQQLAAIKWTMLGTTTKEVIYCVSWL